MNLGQNIAWELKRLHLFNNLIAKVSNPILDKADSLTTEAMFIHLQIAVPIKTE